MADERLAGASRERRDSGARLTVAELIAPERIYAANAGHGISCARMPDGGTFVASAKPIESAARAMIMHVPDVLRVDVSPQQDSVRVVARRLQRDPGLAFGHEFGGHEGWRASDTDLPPRDGSIPSAIRVYAEVPGGAVLADLLVITHWEAHAQVVHLSMRGVLRRIDPGSVRLR